MDTEAQIIINLVVGVICGVICAALAANKGRSTVGWFFLGFLFGIIPLIIIACLSNKKDVKAKEDRQERENRRLREQLRQERMKSEAFRQHASARLDAHDQNAGIDTRAANMALPGPGTQQPMLDNMSDSDALDQLAGGDDDGYEITPANYAEQGAAASYGAQQAQPQHAQPQQQQPAYAAASTPSSNGRHWHYEDSGETRGPISEQQLISKLQSGEIAGGTLLWTEELGDWKAAQDIRALQPFLRS